MPWARGVSACSGFVRRAARGERRGAAVNPAAASAGPLLLLLLQLALGSAAAIPPSLPGRRLAQSTSGWQGGFFGRWVAAGGSEDGAEPQPAQPARPPTDRLPPIPASKPRDTCVCAFDFDGVLRAAPPGARDQDVPAPDAKRVVQGCKDAGYEIAIASANDDIEKMKKVLGQRLDPSVFTEAFFDSSAFQMHYDDKSITLSNIIRYYDTQPGCVMLFDDQEWNKAYASDLGVLMIMTPTNAGIRYADFARGAAELQRYCDCAPPAERSYSDFSRAPPDRSYLPALEAAKAGSRRKR
ncbi:hypothetical protein HXX76_009175 [Chlamydomonas incerta]|uniref:Uncharacterized protein n=1 Tax=Chlamydomonas incerta TaxID=51695 RepID=A0A835SVG3_CHLIN|nr:hypothetical protein HXX76_009175 [Chlamydomonas incerta]|eukprot:KAG2432257.1 hypothetical protein HXX76_009175 [Chlamydomonas incerta]